MNWIDSIKERHACEDVGVTVCRVENPVIREFKKESGDSGLFQGIATTGSVDLDDEVVVPDGLDWSYALTHPAMYPSHQDYGTGPIAKLLNVKRKGSGWYFTGQFLSESENARQWHAICKEMGTFGVSIGFKALERRRPTDDEKKLYGPHSYIIPKALVIELSPTFMPANPDAIAQFIGKGKMALTDDQTVRLERMVKAKRVSVELARSIGYEPKRKTIVLLSA
jgi:hypothetical protein